MLSDVISGLWSGFPREKFAFTSTARQNSTKSATVDQFNYSQQDVYGRDVVSHVLQWYC